MLCFEPFLCATLSILFYFVCLAITHFVYQCSPAKNIVMEQKNKRQCRRQNEGESQYDIIVIGSGVVGSAMASALARDGRSVLCIERDLNEPDRIVGELLQPGGVEKLHELQMEDCLEGIDSPKMNGYGVFYDGQQVDLRYPENADGSQPYGRSFHYGRFVSNLRRHATKQENCTMVQGTVMKFIEEDAVDCDKRTVRGVTYQRDDGTIVQVRASLTIVANGAGSSLTKCLNDAKPIIPSHFIGLKMKNAALKLPCQWRGNVFMVDPSPVLMYPISSTDVRVLVDYPGKKLPNIANGDMQKYLLQEVMPQLPECIHQDYRDTVLSGDIRTVPNREMASQPVFKLRGAMLLGDAFNCRHALTGGGMTVGLSDVVLLRDLLSKVEDLDVFEDVEENILPAFYHKRRTVSSTINILANALYAIFAPNHCSSKNGNMVSFIRSSVVRYFKIGGVCESGPVGLLAGLVKSPYVLLIHFFSVAFVGCWDQLAPFPTLGGIYKSIQLLQSAVWIVGPLIAEEGLLKFVFPPYIFKRNKDSC
ncbi:squalene monooxygenase [Acrasis kona]|uniref:Squalene monooxygenase n=1 Tax=Acrasis kona TaxID=1008807 RepID=A0AAW2YYE0_9EUKA